MGYFQDIYNDGFNPAEDGKPSGEEYTAALKSAQEYTEKILALLDEDGEKLFEDFLSAKADVVSFKIAKAFEQGVIFGSNFIIEFVEIR